MSIDITVVMPALNEEKNIVNALNSTFNSFSNFSLNGEVVVINDGSSDKTADIVKEEIKKTNKSIRLLEHNTPKGIGVCFREAVLEARGKGVVLLPGDNENDPNEIMRYARLLESTDIVVPFIDNKKEARGSFRNFVSSVFTFILNMTFTKSFRYTNGTTLYKRDILKNIQFKSKGFFFQAELLIRAASKGYRYIEVPCKLGKRDSGASKALSFSNLGKVIKGYLILVKDIYLSKKM